MFKLCTIFSASHIDFFKTIYLKNLPKNVKDVKVHFINDFYGANFDTPECKQCGMRKIEIINELVQSGEENDLIMYTDLDVIFNKERDISEIQDLIQDYDMAFQIQDYQAVLAYQTGVILIKVNEATKKFWQHIYNNREKCLEFHYVEMQYINVQLRQEEWKHLKILSVEARKFAAKHFSFEISSLHEDWLLYHLTCWPSLDQKVEYLKQQNFI